METPQTVLRYWFEELTRQQWFQVSAEVDAVIVERFWRTHLELAKGKVAEWRGSPDDRLAGIIVLDQFSRNIYRGTPLAFAADWMALARENIERELSFLEGQTDLTDDEKALIEEARASDDYLGTPTVTLPSGTLPSVTVPLMLPVPASRTTVGCSRCWPPPTLVSTVVAW